MNTGTELLRSIAIVAGIMGVAAFAVPGCGDDVDDEFERTLTVDISHRVVLPASDVHIELGGTRRMTAHEADVHLSGNIDGRDVEHRLSVELERDGDVGELGFELNGQRDLWPVIEPGEAGDFRGEMRIEFEDVLGVAASAETDRLNWRFVRELSPQLGIEYRDDVFPNARIPVEGSGVLRPDEGRTVAVIEEGEFEADAGHSLDLTGRHLPVVWSGDRLEGALHIDPTVVGVHPGNLQAGLRFENRFEDGTTLVSEAGSQRLETEMETTFIASITPEAASRGQLVEIQGRGFVDGEASYGMLLRFEGTVTPTDSDMEVIDFEEQSTVERIPYQVVNDERLVQDIWYEVVDRQLEGLGATPGVFEGTLTPVVYDEHGQVDGIPWEGQFEILPTKQVVYLKYLPSFTVALDRYGLVNVEHEIQKRILEVVQRDYADFNVEFVDEPPEDFAEYATVELGGPDPTGGVTFGVDNTFEGQAKDTGNLHLDSYLGGINRETGEQLGTPFGGVFVESFVVFSETLHPQISVASERFDDIFGPFMSESEFGGEEVRASEWPDGERADKIEQAIRVFGSVVGNTVSHEVGHALGMAHFPEDWENPDLHIFHNTDSGGYIMDAGMERSFEQRAEIDGHGPMEFNDTNRAYLADILPTE